MWQFGAHLGHKKSYWETAAKRTIYSLANSWIPYGSMLLNCFIFAHLLTLAYVV